MIRINAIAASLISLFAIGSASAQSPDEVQIGPVDYTQNVNNVPINLTARTYLKIQTADNKIYLKVKLIGDLGDLQRKIGAVVDTFSLPSNNCAHFSPKNFVVDLPRKELAFRDGQAIFSIGGTVVDWECAENPVPNSKLEWKIRKIGFGIKTKVPVVTTWPGNPIKTKIVSQSFDADLPVRLVRSNESAAGLQFSRPDIELKGQYAFITKGVLSVAGVDVNQKAYDALQKAIDPSKLVLTIPPEIQKFNPVIEDAKFIDDQGQLAAEIDLSALVPASAINELIKQLLAAKKA